MTSSPATQPETTIGWPLGSSPMLGKRVEGWGRRFAPSTYDKPHQRVGASICSGGSIGPTVRASSHDSALEYGSWTCNSGPSCGSSCLNAVYGGARPSNRAPPGSPHRAESVTVATQPTLRSSGATARLAGGQPGGGGPDGPTDRASTQA